MKKPEIAVYYFPNYHIDRFNEARHGQGWNEWVLLKAARPRFDGHQQPKVPLWGYEDESLPEVMERKIRAAADSGIRAFIYDWYWYDHQPYLQGCLENGFLNASNTKDLKFSLMWANHDWNDIFPARKGVAPKNFTKGSIRREDFDEMTDYVIKTYFVKPNYWLVGGGCYFSIYDLPSLIKGIGSVEETRAALQDFRRKVGEAGLGGLHLNVIVTKHMILPSDENLPDQKALIEFLGFDSITSYCWLHHVQMSEFPCTAYDAARRSMITENGRLFHESSIPYYPNVSMGWDSSPRTDQSVEYENLGYPYISVLSGNTPREFGKALQDAATLLEQAGDPDKIITINAWNEWTEGSYLEPDTLNGMAYLDEIREIMEQDHEISPA
jgi:hypothetical protein